MNISKDTNCQSEYFPFLYTCIFGRANIVKQYSEVKFNTVGLKTLLKFKTILCLEYFPEVVDMGSLNPAARNTGKLQVNSALYFQLVECFYTLTLQQKRANIICSLRNLSY